MGSCCDGTNDSDSQRERKPKQSRPQNQFKYVKYANPPQAKSSANYRQSASVRNPNLVKESKGSPSEKSSNSETLPSNKANNPSNRPFPLTTFPAISSNSQPMIIYQPQRPPLNSSSSLPKQKKSYNPQPKFKVNIEYHQNQLPITQTPTNYDKFQPPRRIFEPIPQKQIPKQNPYNAHQSIIISPHDRPKEVIQTIQKPIQQSLNQKFENTVRNSQISQSLRYSMIQLQEFSHHGLPNIGNTCYLNSILQMVFAAEDLRNEIIRIAKRKRFAFHQLIANAYKDIINKSSQDKQRVNMLRILRHIEKKDPQFSQYKQNDAVQCFLCVMNLLDEEQPSNSKLDFYFKIEYEPRCKCTKDGSFIVDDHFVKSQQYCVRCKQNISFFIHSTGPYIIIFSNSQRKGLRKEMQLVTKDSKMKYENKAFVTYFGNHRSGHYIAHRKIENGWIEISDSSVKLIGHSSNIHHHAPMITLYSLKKA